MGGLWSIWVTLGRFSSFVLVAFIGLCVASPSSSIYGAPAKHTTTRRIRERLPRAAQQRIASLGRSHPSLNDAQLAQLFSRDPKLGSLSNWTVQEVGRLRRNRHLPTKPERDQILAKAAIALLRTRPKSEGAQETLRGIRQQHPGVDEAGLLRLAADHPALAKALLPHYQQGARPQFTQTRLSLAQARTIPLSWKTVLRSIERQESAVVGRLFDLLGEIERTHGNGDGRLSPRDLQNSTDPLIAMVMQNVYRLSGGKRVLSLATIRKHLPEAIVKAARKGRGTHGEAIAGLFLNVLNESIDTLSLAYHEQVIIGLETPQRFAEAMGIAPARWANIKKQLPSAFPSLENLPLDEARLETLAQLYSTVLSGAINAQTFYRKSGLSTALLAMLQSARPELFPRGQDSKGYAPLNGSRSVAIGEGKLETLSSQWLSNVVNGAMGFLDFARQSGYSRIQLERITDQHPDYFPRAIPPLKVSQPLALAVGQLASQLFDRNCLLGAKNIIAAINSDARFVGRHGLLDNIRYQQLRALAPDRYPPLANGPENQQYVDGKLGAEIVALRTLHPELFSPQLDINGIANLLQKKYAQLKLSRVANLRHRKPLLFAAQATKRVNKASRLNDARMLADLLKANATAGRSASLAVIATQLEATDARYTKDYLYRLRGEFRESIFAGSVLSTATRQAERSGYVAQELFALVLELAPPGTPEAALRLVMNELLVERGLRPFPPNTPLLSIFRKARRKYGTVRDHEASKLAEIASEYATFHPRAKEADVREMIVRDYPLVTAQVYGLARSRWLAHPDGSPALRALLRGEARAPLKKGTALRYVGGWNVARQLASRDSATARKAVELAKRSQFARIPLQLPLLEKLVADLNGRRPLKDKNLLVCSHLLATHLPLMKALRDAGSSVERTRIVGTPYGSNESVVAALRDDGYRIRVAKLESGDFRREIKKAFEEILAEHDKNNQPIVVLDDGGTVAELLHQMVAENPSKYRKYLKQIRIVEQTSRGIFAAEELKLKVPIINVARADMKKVEAAFIGRAVAAKVAQGLIRQSSDLRGKKATVIGYGLVGEAVARELAARGVDVTVVETGRTRRDQARAAKDDSGRPLFRVKTKEEAFPSADVVLGTTGQHRLGAADFALMKDGTVIASASSKDLEVNKAELIAASSKIELLKEDNPLVRLPTRRYHLAENKRLTLLGDGWPINFDGDVEDIPAAHIQVTRGAMFLAALQAAGTNGRFKKNQGLIPLERDAEGVEAFQALRHEKVLSDHHDPSRWFETVRALTVRVNAAIASTIVATMGSGS